jgi:hypothetical protein
LLDPSTTDFGSLTSTTMQLSWPSSSSSPTFPCVHTFAWLLLLPYLFQTAAALQINVCQNKECFARFKGASSLPRILKDLSLPNASITATGCLSLCHKGPNIAVLRNPNDKTLVKEKEYIHGLSDPMTVFLALESRLGPMVPKLKAAIQVMERGQTGKNTLLLCIC